MSKGNDVRTDSGRGEAGRSERNPGREPASRNSRSSIQMTAERARAIHSRVDRTAVNQVGDAGGGLSVPDPVDDDD